MTHVAYSPRPPPDVVPYPPGAPKDGTVAPRLPALRGGPRKAPPAAHHITLWQPADDLSSPRSVGDRSTTVATPSPRSTALASSSLSLKDRGAPTCNTRPSILRSNTSTQLQQRCQNNRRFREELLQDLQRQAHAHTDQTNLRTNAEEMRRHCRRLQELVASMEQPLLYEPKLQMDFPLEEKDQNSEDEDAPESPSPPPQPSTPTPQDDESVSSEGSEEDELYQRADDGSIDEMVVDSTTADLAGVALTDALEALRIIRVRLADDQRQWTRQQHRGVRHALRRIRRATRRAEYYCKLTQTEFVSTTTAVQQYETSADVRIKELHTHIEERTFRHHTLLDELQQKEEEERRLKEEAMILTQLDAEEDVAQGPVNTMTPQELSLLDRLQTDFHRKLALKIDEATAREAGMTAKERRRHRGPTDSRKELEALSRLIGEHNKLLRLLSQSEAESLRTAIDTVHDSSTIRLMRNLFGEYGAAAIETDEELRSAVSGLLATILKYFHTFADLLTRYLAEGNPLTDEAFMKEWLKIVADDEDVEASGSIFGRDEGALRRRKSRKTDIYTQFITHGAAAVDHVVHEERAEGYRLVRSVPASLSKIFTSAKRHKRAVAAKGSNTGSRRPGGGSSRAVSNTQRSAAALAAAGTLVGIGARIRRESSVSPKRAPSSI